MSGEKGCLACERPAFEMAPESGGYVDKRPQCTGRPGCARYTTPGGLRVMRPATDSEVRAAGTEGGADDKWASFAELTAATNRFHDAMVKVRAVLDEMKVVDDSRAARDRAVAEAVRDECSRVVGSRTARYAVDEVDLDAVIATIAKEAQG